MGENRIRGDIRAVKMDVMKAKYDGAALKKRISMTFKRQFTQWGRQGSFKGATSHAGNYYREWSAKKLKLETWSQVPGRRSSVHWPV